MASPFLGQITVYSFGFPPYGWADCAGQLLPISQYAALFSLLGTQFGGNGTSNFGLPDLQGRIPIGQGQLSGGENYIIGEVGGSENVTILTTSMPMHNHTLGATTADGSTNSPSGMILAQPLVAGHRGSNDSGNIYNPGTIDTPLASTAVGTAGGSIPHNNIQPSLVVRYCIALQGQFPTRP